MTLKMSDAEYLNAIARLGGDVVRLQIEARRRGRDAFAANCRAISIELYREQTALIGQPDLPPRHRGHLDTP